MTLQSLPKLTISADHYLTPIPGPSRNCDTLSDYALRPRKFPSVLDFTQSPETTKESNSRPSLWCPRGIFLN
jgi:hypothetical protein